MSDKIKGEIDQSELPDAYAIESAISSVVDSINNTDSSTTLIILNQHLRELCNLQLKILKGR